MANPLRGEIAITAPDGEAWTFRLTVNDLIELGKTYGKDKPFEWLLTQSATLEEMRAIIHRGALPYKSKVTPEAIGELMTSLDPPSTESIKSGIGDLWKGLVCAAFNTPYPPVPSVKPAPKEDEEPRSSAGPGESSSTKPSLQD